MYPDQYLSYLVHFHADRDYFECHEILEEYWKSLPQESRSHVWVGLIQIAVALYHHRRNNFTGAEKMLQSAIKIIHNIPHEFSRLALEVDQLTTILQKRLELIQNQELYTSIDLPIVDESLRKQCQDAAEKKGLFYGQPSNLANHFLCNKHSLRDRSDVIDERKRSLLTKTARRNP